MVVEVVGRLLERYRVDLATLSERKEPGTEPENARLYLSLLARTGQASIVIPACLLGMLPEAFVELWVDSI